MKTYLWASSLCTALAFGATDTIPHASNAKPELPPMSLSLSRSAKSAPFDLSATQSNKGAIWVQTRPPLRTTQIVSRMPILAPKAAPDHMPVAHPDPTVEFKLLTKKPAIKSVP